MMQYSSEHLIDPWSLNGPGRCRPPVGQEGLRRGSLPPRRRSSKKEAVGRFTYSEHPRPYNESPCDRLPFRIFGRLRSNGHWCDRRSSKYYQPKAK